MDNQFPLPNQTPPSPMTLPPIPPLAETTPSPKQPSDAAPPPPDYSAPKPATAPKKTSIPTKLILIILGILLLVGGIIFAITKIISSGSSSESSVAPKQTVTLNYWGLWESETVMKPVIAEFEKQNPTIKINYIFQSPKDYQDRVANEMSGNNPPDIVRLHSMWLPIFASSLAIAPPNTVTASDISTNFPSIVSKLLTNKNIVYGVPMAADGLVLYLNTTMFQQKSLTYPETWNDVLDDALALKQTDSITGKLSRAGIALGSITNVDHWPDILSLMLLQSGVPLDNPVGSDASITYNFFLDFIRKHHVWDETMPSSTVAFANEKVAMILAPLWRAPEIKQINPSLAWITLPVPQLPESTPVSWASIWFEAVPQNSKHTKEAWQFLSYLSSASAQQLLFESAAQQREYPQSPLHNSLQTQVQQNAFVASFYNSLATARTYYTASDTSDTRLNSRLIKYLEDALNTLSKNQEEKTTFETLTLGFNQVLSQFGLATPLPTKTQ